MSDVPEIIDQHLLQPSALLDAYLQGALVRHTSFRDSTSSRDVSVYRLCTSSSPVYRTLQRTYQDKLGQERVTKRTTVLYAGLDEQSAIAAFDNAATCRSKEDEEIKGETFREPEAVLDALRHVWPLTGEQSLEQIIPLLWTQVVRRLGLGAVHNVSASTVLTKLATDAGAEILSRPPARPLPQETWAFFHDLIGSPLRVYRLQAAYLREEIHRSAPMPVGAPGAILPRGL